MAKRFINEPANVVSDAMGGLALDSCRVSMLDSSTGHNVAVRTSLISKSYTPRVSVLSGGGSGHEPMAMGYVGEGMLAGAVAGDVFAAPPVDAVSALLDVIAPHSTGILFLVMNYQGDRLSFGMSVKEFSKKTDKPIHITYISDDVAKPAAKDNRGISGTIFVIKVAGAAADRGLNFKEVIKIAEAASRSIVSYGVALEPATVPGQPVDIESISSDEIQLGLGIHNEPGAEMQHLSQLDRRSLTSNLVTTICRRLDRALTQKMELASRCTKLAVMVNNLGAVPQAEMLIVMKTVADFLYDGNANVLNGNLHRVHLFVGSFMTSLQMNGVSVSCFMLSKDINDMETFLHARTECTAWNAGFELFPPSQRAIISLDNEHEKSSRKHVDTTANIRHSRELVTGQSSKHQDSSTPISSKTSSQPKSALGHQYSRQNIPQKGARKVYAGANAFSGAANTVTGLSRNIETCILAVTSALQSHCDDLAELDCKTGDGDLGDTVRKGCGQIRDDLEQGRYAHASNSPSELFKAIARSTKVMGGTSGGFTRVFLLAAADKFEELQRQRNYDAERAWRAAFVAGTREVMEEGGAKVGDRTMVDALKPAADVFEHGNGSVSDAAHAAHVGVESTRSMTTAKFGRSSHVRPDKLLNQPDPGALAVSLLLDALVVALSSS